METTFVLNNFPRTNIFISTFLISIQNGFYIIFDVAMITKLKNLSRFYDFIVMETTVVLNNFPKNYFFITTSLISFLMAFFLIFDVAMVTKFKNLS